VTINPDLIDLINGMLEFNPVKRLSFSDINSHIWMQDGNISTYEEVVSEMEKRIDMLRDSN